MCQDLEPGPFNLKFNSEIEAISGESLKRIASQIAEVPRSAGYCKKTSLNALCHNCSAARDVKHLGYTARAPRINPAPTSEGSTASELSHNVERNTPARSRNGIKACFVHVCSKDFFKMLVRYLRTDLVIVLADIRRLNRLLKNKSSQCQRPVAAYGTDYGFPCSL